MTLPILFTLAAFIAPTTHGPGPCLAQNSGQRINYEEFLAVPDEDRPAYFSRLTAGNKACLKRTHATRWLERNRHRLSAGQVDAVQQAIAFVTPEIYIDPSRPEIASRESEIKSALVCKLGRDLAQEAFSFSTQSTSGGNQMSRIERWLSWFSDCVIKLI